MNGFETNNEEVRNPELKKVLGYMNENNSFYNRSRMAHLLTEARLLSPIRQEVVLMEKAGPANRIKFEDITDVNGGKFYLAFTDMDEYNKWNEDGSHDHALIMTLQDFGKLLIRNVNDFVGFVINPYGENVCITKKLLLSILQQHETKMMEKEQAN